MIDAQKILLGLISIKGILLMFGVDVFSNEQAEQIANGLAALVAVVIGIINMVKEAQAQKQLAEVRAELKAAYQD